MAFLRYIMNSGVKIRSAVIIEWVGPLWNSDMPVIMSMSGIIESTNNVGMFGLSLKGLAVALPSR